MYAAEYFLASIKSHTLFLSNTNTIVNKQDKVLFLQSSHSGWETDTFPNSLEYQSMYLKSTG